MGIVLANLVNCAKLYIYLYSNFMKKYDICNSKGMLSNMCAESSYLPVVFRHLTMRRIMFQPFGNIF